MSYDAQIHNLQFDPEVFRTSSAAMTRPLRSRVLACLTRAPWVSPVGGNRSHSEGEPVLVLSRKGKEDCPELLTVLAVILKETWSTLAWFLTPALGSAALPRAKFARGPTVPRTGASAAGEHQRVWCARRRRGYPPLPRGWVAGAKCSRGPTVEKEGNDNKNKKTRKNNQRKTRKK